MQFLTSVKPLDYGHVGTLILFLITEVSSIQRSLNTLQYYTETQNGVLIIEVSAIQRFVIVVIVSLYTSPESTVLKEGANKPTYSRTYGIYFVSSDVGQSGIAQVGGTEESQGDSGLFVFIPVRLRYHDGPFDRPSCRSIKDYGYQVHHYNRPR